MECDALQKTLLRNKRPASGNTVLGFTRLRPSRLLPVRVKPPYMLNSEQAIGHGNFSAAIPGAAGTKRLVVIRVVRRSKFPQQHTFR